MESHNTVPRLPSSHFIKVTLNNYQEDISMPPHLILHAALLTHKIRFAITHFTKELTNEAFFQSEVFKNAPKLDEILPLLEIIADRSMVLAQNRKIRDKALAVVRYTMELLFPCLASRKVKIFVPMLEKIANHFDARNSAIAFACGDIFKEKSNGSVTNASLTLRLGIIQIQSAMHWKELVLGKPERVQEAKALIYWLLLYATNDTLFNQSRLNLCKIDFWNVALETHNQIRAKRTSLKRKTSS